MRIKELKDFGKGREGIARKVAFSGTYTFNLGPNEVVFCSTVVGCLMFFKNGTVVIRTIEVEFLSSDTFCNVVKISHD